VIIDSKENGKKKKKKQKKTPPHPRFKQARKNIL
jgi:hypothetical protein